jgi:hypothetical protein
MINEKKEKMKEGLSKSSKFLSLFLILNCNGN